MIFQFLRDFLSPVTKPAAPPLATPEPAAPPLTTPEPAVRKPTALSPETPEPVVSNYFEQALQELDETNPGCLLCDNKGDLKQMECCGKHVCFKCLYGNRLYGPSLTCPHCRRPDPSVCAEDRKKAFRAAAVQAKKKAISNMRALYRKGECTPAQKRAVVRLKKAEKASKEASRKRSLDKKYRKEMKKIGSKLRREKYPELPSARSSISRFTHERRLRDARNKVAAEGHFVSPVPSWVNQEGGY